MWNWHLCHNHTTHLILENQLIFKDGVFSIQQELVSNILLFNVCPYCIIPNAYECIYFYKHLCNDPYYFSPLHFHFLLNKISFVFIASLPSFTFNFMFPAYFISFWCLEWEYFYFNIVVLLSHFVLCHILC